MKSIPDRKHIIGLINQNTARIRSRRDGLHLTGYIQGYFSRAPMDDLLNRKPHTLTHIAVGHLDLAVQWTSGFRKIRIFNPEVDTDGWDSDHTIVQIVTRNSPFLIDSVTMEINRHGFTTHLIIHPLLEVARNKNRKIQAIREYSGNIDEKQLESFIHIEIDKETDAAALKQLKSDLERVLEDVRVAVTDWQPIVERVNAGIADMEKTAPPQISPEERQESVEFLRWLIRDHFTFLGYREYTFAGNGSSLRAVPESGLGILRKRGRKSQPLTFDKVPPAMRKSAFRNARLLTITKSDTFATVHRPVYLDYIGISRFSRTGRIVGERRIYGLFTSMAYQSSPRIIPLVRKKIDQVIKLSDFLPNSHAGKGLLNILDTYPRDELLQASVDDLLQTAMGILDLQERQRIRAFIRRDPYERFMVCLVFVPRDKFHSGIRQRIVSILRTAFQGTSVDFTTWISQSVYAQLYLVIHTQPGYIPEFDVDNIEKDITAATHTWVEDLRSRLVEIYDHEHGNELYRKFCNAFSASYQEDHSTVEASHDIRLIEAALEEGRMKTNLYRDPGMPNDWVMFKLFSPGMSITLSDALSIFENMGLFIVTERPYEIHPDQKQTVWVYDFGMKIGRGTVSDIALIKDKFQQAFDLVWQGRIENDGFNRLVLKAGISARQVVLFRAYSRYIQQIGTAFSQIYIHDTLYKHPETVTALVSLFEQRFDPHPDRNRDRIVNKTRKFIEKHLDAIASLDEDRILRKFYHLINATLRTNYFQHGDNGAPRDYLALKFDPLSIPDLITPRPMYEIFVYSTRVEGVHLRGGKVARGGIRWSDRREDFRTEILGLMKAQMVKNAIIVPVGAKGGFYVKQTPSDDREAYRNEGIECYRIFIQGLLDLTDNRIGKKIVPPPRVVRYDEDDPYLVVAADKGTAAFSPIANAVADEYGFWLADAFASGGAAGYDHKKMGITAKGAWESVKHHFQILGIDTRSTDFTVIGIGDMSGDVFGNGMLLSRHIKLVAAFNHMHIFLDPDPDPARAYPERKRLFALPGSSWEDYDMGLISPGGGVYSRKLKSIPLSPEVQRLLNVEVEKVNPSELIKLILMAPVDLIWNGGIGTYIKADYELNSDAGDKTNDNVRINASQVRSRVIGEGGNLGITQKGRMVFAQKNGLINADWIDNSGGVACSDREVNIKILLNGLVNRGLLTLKDRNRLLRNMTREVSALVIQDNYRQVRAITNTEHQSRNRLGWYIELIDGLEQKGFSRKQENIPARTDLEARTSSNTGLTRPEIAVILSHTKTTIFQEILNSALPDEPYLDGMLTRYFPRQLQEKYTKQIKDHQLRREIVATVLTNSMVNRAGIPFFHRLVTESGAPIAEITRAYLVAREVFDIHGLYDYIDNLDYKLAVDTQSRLTFEIQHLLRHAARWFLNNNRYLEDISATIKQFSGDIQILGRLVRNLIKGPERNMINTYIRSYRELGVPIRVGSQFAALRTRLAALAISDLSRSTQIEFNTVAEHYFALGRLLRFYEIRKCIEDIEAKTIWEDRTRVADIQELYRLASSLTSNVMSFRKGAGKADSSLNSWTSIHKNTIGTYLDTLGSINLGTTSGLPAISVVLDKLQRLERETVTR